MAPTRKPDLRLTLAVVEARGWHGGPAPRRARFRGVPVDILIADPWVGIPSLKRARRKTFLGRPLRIATPEDLIIMKTLADRPVDRRDVEELKELFRGRLDKGYIARRIRQIREEMDRA